MKGSAFSSSRKIWISCMKALMYLCSGLTGALVLVVYCLKSVPDAWYPGGVCQLLGVGATALAHKWKHNTFLSILAGTAVYMVLLRVL